MMKPITAFTNALVGIWLILSHATTLGQLAVESDFDRGSIGELKEIRPGFLKGTTRHCKKQDGIGDQRYWFYFKLNGVENRPVTVHLDDLVGVYRGLPHHVYTARTLPVYSYDRKHWERISDVKHSSEDGSFEFTQTFTQSEVWIAYAHPYTWEQADALVKSLAGNKHCKTQEIGASVNKRPIRLVTITDFSVPDHDKKKVFIQAFQHPGEDCVGYFMEGLMERLLSDAPEARAARRGIVFHLIPMVNPDGAFEGNCRYNTNGEDLNNIWLDDGVGQPEVNCIRDWLKKRRREGLKLDLFLDIHSHSQKWPSNTIIWKRETPADFVNLLNQNGFPTDSRVSESSSAAAHVAGVFEEAFCGTVEMTQSHLGDGRYLDVEDYRKFGAGTVTSISAFLSK